MGSNNGFTMFYKYVRKAQVYSDFTMGSQGAYAQFVRKKGGFYNNFYNINTDALFPVLIHFIYNIHTGELGSGLTFISFATVLFLLP